MNIMPDHANNFVSSGLARAIQSTIGNPIIVIKTRLEVLGFSEYTGFTDAVLKMYKNEGLGSFFTGLKISLIRDVPFSGIFYPIYEFCKHFFSMLLMYNRYNETSKRRLLMYTALISSLSSISANLFSCLITHPLDIIRTRVFF